MPTITVQKITGPMTTLMSWMNRSARILSDLANPGANRPTRMPAVMPMSTQNQSWV
jgi:hypothetical protein